MNWGKLALLVFTLSILVGMGAVLSYSQEVVIQADNTSMMQAKE